MAAIPTVCWRSGRVAWNNKQPGQMATLFHVGQAEAKATNASVSEGKPPLGARLLRWPDGRITGNVGNAELRAALADTLTAGNSQRAKVRTIILENGASAEALTETIAPPVMLALFGGGDDALPLARLPLCSDGVW